MQESSIYSALVTGIIISLVRINEPYFKFVIKREVWSWFGELLSEEDVKCSEEAENDSLSAALASSLNVELVYVILETISTKCSGRIRP